MSGQAKVCTMFHFCGKKSRKLFENLKKTSKIIEDIGKNTKMRSFTFWLASVEI